MPQLWGGGTSTDTRLRVASIAALKAVGYSALADGEVAEVAGYHGEGTPGGGWFYWDAAAADTADDGHRVNPTGNLGAGRWVRRVPAWGLTPADFGCPGDSTEDGATGTECSARLQKWLDFAGPILADDRRHYLTAQVVATRAWRGRLQVRSGITSSTVAVLVKPPGTVTWQALTAPLASGVKTLTPPSVSGAARGMVLAIRSNRIVDVVTRSTMGERRMIADVTDGVVTLENGLFHAYGNHRIANCVISSGTGAAVGDVFRLKGADDDGTYSEQFEITVQQVSSAGRILTFSINAWGNYTALPAGQAYLDPVTGTGTTANCTVALEQSHVAFIPRLEGEWDLDVRGNGVTLAQQGAEFRNLWGGKIVFGGSATISRALVVYACTSMRIETRNGHDQFGTTSYFLSIGGASRDIRVDFQGANWFSRHISTTSNPTPAEVSGTPVNITFANAVIESSAPYLANTASLTGEDTTADTVTLDVALANGAQIRFTTAGSLPGGLTAAPQSYWLRAVSLPEEGGSGTYLLYPTANDYRDITNQVDITSAHSGTVTATIVTGGDAADTHGASFDVWYENITVAESAALGINLECCGGGLSGITRVLRSEDSSVYLHNKTLFDATWHISGRLISRNAGRHGLAVATGLGTNDKLLADVIDVAGSADMDVYFFRRGTGTGRIARCGTIATDGGSGQPARVYVRRWTGIIDNIDLQRVPTGVYGLRVNEVDDLQIGRIKALAAGAGTTLARFDAANRCTIASGDLDGAGHASVVGVQIANSCADIHIGPTTRIRNCATDVSPGTGGGHVDMRPE